MIEHRYFSHLRFFHLQKRLLFFDLDFWLLAHHYICIIEHSLNFIANHFPKLNHLLLQLFGSFLWSMPFFLNRSLYNILFCLIRLLHDSHWHQFRWWYCKLLMNHLQGLHLLLTIVKPNLWNIISTELLLLLFLKAKQMLWHICLLLHHLHRLDLHLLHRT